MSSPLANGTYFIGRNPEGTFLEFSSGTIGLNLTAWAFTGNPEQQWMIAGSDSGYTVKNVLYGTYVSFTQPSPGGGLFITASGTPFNWFVEASEGGFLFSETPTFDDTWNIDGGFSNNDQPIILYQCCSVFLLNATSSVPSGSTSTSPLPSETANSTVTNTNSNVATNSSHLSAGVDAGIAIGAVVVALLIIGGAILVYRKWWRRPASAPAPAPAPALASTEALPGWASDPLPSPDEK